MHKGDFEMVNLIVGKKGSGKTKAMLDTVALALSNENGDIVFINHGDRHIYHLNHSIRLIDIEEYGVKTFSEFKCFLNGALSQNYDISHIFIDSLFKVVPEGHDELAGFINDISAISDEYAVDFTITISADKEELPEAVYEYIS